MGTGEKNVWIDHVDTFPISMQDGVFNWVELRFFGGLHA